MLKKMVGLLLVILIGLGAAAGVYIQQPKFGRAPSAARLAQIKASPHYYNGKFQCVDPIASIMESNDSMVTGWLKFFTSNPPDLKPQEPLPTAKINILALNQGEDLVVWLGHSSFYMQLAGRRILIDPVLSDYGSPIFFINRAFAGTTVYRPEDIPPIDILIMSHEHWDHLDYGTIMALKPKIKDIVCPLGVGEYFEYWGFAKEHLHEEDWDTEVKLAPDFSIFVLPAQHFSNRIFKQDQNQWAGFAFVTKEKKVFYSGDSGYGSHFKKLGEQFGGFDLAILENGQYNKEWHRIHMLPEETAQAAVDLKAKAVLPCHNGKFAMARHAWYEPLQKLKEYSAGKAYQLLTPEIGTLVRIPPAESTQAWWEKLK